MTLKKLARIALTVAAEVLEAEIQTRKQRDARIRLCAGCGAHLNRREHAQHEPLCLYLLLARI